MRRFSPLLWMSILISLLSVFSLIAAQENLLIPNGDPTTITFDDSTSEVTLHIDGHAGDIITLNVEQLEREDTILMRLTLLLPDGAELFSETSDGIPLYGMTTRPYLLPQDGTYSLVVTHLRAIPSGEYAVSLTRRETPLLIPDEVVTDTLRNGIPQLDFLIQGIAGEQIIITAQAFDFDPEMRLLSSSGEELAYSDDQPNRISPQIGPLELPEDGTYRVVVSRYDDEAVAGRIDVSYTILPAEYLHYGESQTVTLANEDIEIPFLGREGEIASVIVEYEGNEPPPVTVSTPSISNTIARNIFAGGYGYYTDRFPILISGEHVITIQTTPTINSGDVTITLEKIGDGYFNLRGEARVELTEKSPNTSLIARIEPNTRHRLNLRLYAWNRGEAYTFVTLHIMEGDTLIDTVTIDFGSIWVSGLEILLDRTQSEEITIEIETDATQPVSIDFTIEEL